MCGLMFLVCTQTQLIFVLFRFSHDDVLENSGKGGKPFTQKNEAQVTEMKCLFLDT
jgi:hypothetical protein